MGEGNSVSLLQPHPVPVPGEEERRSCSPGDGGCSFIEIHDRLFVCRLHLDLHICYPRCEFSAWTQEGYVCAATGFVSAADYVHDGLVSHPRATSLRGDSERHESVDFHVEQAYHATRENRGYSAAAAAPKRGKKRARTALEYEGDACRLYEVLTLSDKRQDLTSSLLFNRIGEFNKAVTRHVSHANEACVPVRLSVVYVNFHEIVLSVLSRVYLDADAVRDACARLAQCAAHLWICFTYDLAAADPSFAQPILSKYRFRLHCVVVYLFASQRNGMVLSARTRPTSSSSSSAADDDGGRSGTRVVAPDPVLALLGLSAKDIKEMGYNPRLVTSHRCTFVAMAWKCIEHGINLVCTPRPL